MIKQVIAEEREVGLVVIEEGLREGLEVGPEGLQPLGVELLGLEGYLGHGLQLVEPEPHHQGPAGPPRREGWPWLFHGPRRSWGAARRRRAFRSFFRLVWLWGALSRPSAFLTGGGGRCVGWSSLLTALGAVAAALLGF